MGGVQVGGVGGWVGGVGWGGGQGGCERRIEVFLKIQRKKCFFLGGGRGRDVVSGWGVGGGGGRSAGWGGVRVDVNEELKFL